MLPNGKLENDRHQDCRLIRANPKNMHFRFKRKFLTCDSRDYAIEVRKMLYFKARFSSQKLKNVIFSAKFVLTANIGFLISNLAVLF